ncbi:MAG TPA: nucleotidyltransferase family protein [Gemmatimonadaceae bacterium]|nr:nucleotidyltransferase family protein [Gemmatimonadaceae bacterium]
MSLPDIVERSSGEFRHSGAFRVPTAPLRRARLADALSVLLPRSDQSWLLRACLLSAEPGRDAWRQWQRFHEDVKAALSDDASGAKQILPLLYTTLKRNGADLDPSLRPYLTTSYAREEMRNEAYRAIGRAALQALAAHGVNVIAVKGAALAESVYGHPAQRHSHDIDLLVAPDDLDRAIRALASARFTRAAASLDHGALDVRLDHPSGLPVELHGTLFAIPFYDPPMADVWQRTRPSMVAGVATRTLTPEMSLVHVCGHASYSWSRQSLRWVCDAWFIIEREADLDWHEVLDIARRTRLTLPLLVMIRYLHDTCGARVPGLFLARLGELFDRAPAVERDVALFAARSGTREPLLSILRRMPGGWRTQASAVRWLLFPSREYLKGEAVGKASTGGSFRYLSRVIEYARGSSTTTRAWGRAAEQRTDGSNYQ